jgi:hypothetical protein
MAKDFSSYIKKGLISESDIEFLATLDPSSTQKYLPFIVKSYVAGANLDQIRNRVSEYAALLNKNQLDRKDINSFKTFSQFDQYVQQYNNIKSARQEKREAKEQAEIIIDNENLFLICPHSHSATCLYGAGSKWCITMDNAVHFERYYYGELVTFFIIQVRSDAIKAQLEEDLWKLAVAVYRDGRIAVYDAADHQVAGINIRFQKFVPPDELFFTLGVEADVFVPRRIDERIPAVLASLNNSRVHELDLSRAGITKVPEEIGNITQLQTLTLSENKIEALPETIGLLTNLRCLYLFHNRLTSLPESLYTMGHLQWLGLTGNIFSNRVLRDLKTALPYTRIYFEKRKAA